MSMKSVYEVVIALAIAENCLAGSVSVGPNFIPTDESLRAWKRVDAVISHWLASSPVGSPDWLEARAAADLRDM